LSGIKTEKRQAARRVPDDIIAARNAKYCSSKAADLPHFILFMDCSVAKQILAEAIDYWAVSFYLSFIPVRKCAKPLTKFQALCVIVCMITDTKLKGTSNQTSFDLRYLIYGMRYARINFGFAMLSND
jgi:hypothetical protein